MLWWLRLKILKRHTEPGVLGVKVQANLSPANKKALLFPGGPSFHYGPFKDLYLFYFAIPTLRVIDPQIELLSRCTRQWLAPP